VDAGRCTVEVILHGGSVTLEYNVLVYLALSKSVSLLLVGIQSKAKSIFD